jgi:hypothetical protein
MAYTPITEINDPALNYFQWSTPTYPTPMLAASIDDDDTTIYFTAPPTDREGNVITGNFLFGTQKANGYIETIYVPDAGMSADGLTATGCVRGVRLSGLDVTTGDSDLAVAHLKDQPVFCNISATIQAITISALTAGIGGNIKFNGRPLYMGEGISADRVFADAAARDAAIISPQDGDSCYLVDSGQFYDRQGGSWQARANGVNPNASETVAGKTEEATQTESDDGDVTGDTGAKLFMTPLKSARAAQKNAWQYIADTGSVDAYVADLSPAPTAYAEGLELFVKITNTNTGACTIDVNSLGAKTITTKEGGDPLPGDLPADAIVHLIYNGTEFQLMSVTLTGVGFGSADAEYTTGVLGENFSASDITNNQNLAYQNTDMKWYKVSSTTTTWYRRLGIVCEAGSTDETKRILLKGRYANQSFVNINPTFSSALTGAAINVGNNNASSLAALVVDNSSGAEAIVTGGTISAREQGTPSGAMQIYLVLEQQDQSDSPAMVRDTTNNVGVGAVIGSATINEALFSGSYQDLAFSFGSPVKIPAGATVYLVVGKSGADDASNYYQIQSNGATKVFNSSTWAWSGTASTGNLTLTVTDTSPVGYSVKAYQGTNGTYGITPDNPWSKPIGQVLSSNEFLFDPEQRKSNFTGANIYLAANFLNIQGIDTQDFGFCPSMLQIESTVANAAGTNTYYKGLGSIRGDTSASGAFIVNSPSIFGTSSSPNLNELSAASNAISNAPLFLQGLNGGVMNQNRIYAARLETGAYIYCGYPSGGSFFSAGNATYTATGAILHIRSS